MNNENETKKSRITAADIKKAEIRRRKAVEKTDRTDWAGNYDDRR